MIQILLESLDSMSVDAIKSVRDHFIKFMNENGITGLHNGIHYDRLIKTIDYELSCRID